MESLIVGAGDPPAWTILRSGHTTRGWPWFLVRKIGGQQVRVTVAPHQATGEGIMEAIDVTVRRLPAAPGPDCF